MIRKLKFIQDTRDALPTSSRPLSPSAPMWRTIYLLKSRQMVTMTGELGRGEVVASQSRGRLAYSPGQEVTSTPTRMMTAREASEVEWSGSREFGCTPAESEVCGRYRLQLALLQHSGLVLLPGLQFLILSEGKGDEHIRIGVSVGLAT